MLAPSNDYLAASGKGRVVASHGRQYHAAPPPGGARSTPLDQETAMCGRYAVFGPVSVPQDALPILREMDRHHRKNAPQKQTLAKG